MYDRARDLYVKLPIMKLTPEQEGETTRTMAGVVELRRVTAALSTVYPEFAANVRTLDAGLDKFLVTARSKLLQQYLRSQDVEKIQSLSETLGAIIATGKWPDWQLDFDMAIEGRCQSPSIQPKLKLVRLPHEGRDDRGR
jgi:hypothetical protein